MKILGIKLTLIPKISRLSDWVKSRSLVRIIHLINPCIIIRLQQGMVDGSASKPALRQDTGFWGLFNI